MLTLYTVCPYMLCTQMMGSVLAWSLADILMQVASKPGSSTDVIVAVAEVRAIKYGSQGTADGRRFPS